MTFDRYGSDVLADFSRRPARKPVASQEAQAGLVFEDVASDFCGSVTHVEGKMVELEDRHGRRRMFPLGGGFLYEGTPVILIAPGVQSPQPRAARTASGSIKAPDARARVARASRIFVEGRHDAELVEKVWGDDLRSEAVVVEYLEGVDHLDEVLKDFAPTAERRVGVLVDHLVSGSKESRIADSVMRSQKPGSVLIVGHPYVDVWQSVKPGRLGLPAWPVVPRSIEWKHGICEALGWPHAEQADIAAAWQRILGRVRTYTDLEPELLGRVEQLIDFVTAPVEATTVHTTRNGGR
ncbi:DUF3097 domain-containing protein [Subtercola sp. PAMC28395]|uniref:DUF3097 domain-containing protein n=1 Tax=Subtercola sp. PAMC28395 TaxID=2846775 RepID=UPI001C0C211B|nr:DUF3097 domain-containing protein [Subtercola sp. PAMC28395]QWT23152.1 DUF3097 domain-containing protein [Subtercola sp. PAMC28395]